MDVLKINVDDDDDDYIVFRNYLTFPKMGDRADVSEPGGPEFDSSSGQS